MELPLMDEPDAFIVEDLDVFKRLAWYSLAGHDRPYTHVKGGKLVIENPTKYIR